MTDIDTQLHHAFDQLGINTKDIRYNEKIDRWIVEPTGEGSDDRYLKSVTEIGASGAVDYTLDFNAVRAAIPEIDGTDIPAGTIRIDGTDSATLLITID